MTLDEELKEAGMLTISELMEGQPIDGFIANKAVNDLPSFMKWLDMRSKEMLRIKARMILDKNTDTEMHEWVLSHCAAFNEVRVNLNAVLKGT